MDDWKREKAELKACRSLFPLPIFLCVLDFSGFPQPTYDTKTVSAEESQEGILITCITGGGGGLCLTNELENNSARDQFLLIVRFTL